MPELYEVLVAESAGRDLDDIFGFISQRSPQNATRMVDLLVRSIESLDMLPRRYPVVARAERLFV